MSASALFYITVAAVVVLILLTALVALVFESDWHPPVSGQETAKPGDEAGQTAGAEQKAA